ncbi:MAG TPA: MaoC/PaaZ C-terminal domain-containing protein [Kofleriaceae bacterium]|nr:MaoC/PaaZ C-terminal domain-containing protein [Kofleriaceae bacterium]
MKHILEHGPMLRALGATAIAAVRGPSSTASADKPATPGPWFETEVKAPSADLVRAFVAFTKGDQATYRGVVPPHLFPQWTLASASRALGGVPYPLAKIVNAGVSLDLHARIPAGEPLVVRARLESIDESPSRVLMATRIETGTASAPDALVATLRTYVPLSPRSNGANGEGGANGSNGAKRSERAAPPSVADGARELAFIKVPANAGLEFAKLTGDFNPIHWIPAYARTAGFKACILHGFGEFAYATSALVRGLLSGDASKLRAVEARFTKPFVLPGKLGIYVTDAGELFAGDAPGGAAYLAGRFEIGAHS